MKVYCCDNQLQRSINNIVVIGLGANITGAWGAPDVTLRKCINNLTEMGFSQITCSPVYRTRPQSSVRQPHFMNLVATGDCDLLPQELIAQLKRLENNAGRRKLGLNGPRPLDIDLLDHHGRRINWPGGRRRPKLVLPHPAIAARAFVLAPLADLAPEWRHPVSRLTARQMLDRLGGRRAFELRHEIEQLADGLVPRLSSAMELPGRRSR